MIEKGDPVSPANVEYPPETEQIDRWFDENASWLLRAAASSARRAGLRNGDEWSVADEAVMVLYERMTSGWTPDVPEAFVRAVARNKGLEEQRQDKRQRLTAARIRTAPAEAESETLNQREDLARVIERAGLSHRQQSVLSLCWGRQYTDVEAAAELGISPGTLKQHKRRALKKLRGLLNEAIAIDESNWQIWESTRWG